MLTRKTKIICTMGPATKDPEVVRQLMVAGMDVARINFSHDDHAAHLTKVETIKKLREQTGYPVALLCDTRGPEVRLGVVEEGVVLKDGQSFTLTTKEITGNTERCRINFEGLPGDVKKGTVILIDDGLIEMMVEGVAGSEISCRVIHGGPISSRKGVNVPGVSLSMPYMSSKDRADIRFAVENEFDYIAASFCCSARNVKELRAEVNRLGGAPIRIIAKIENAEGVENIDEIIEAADGIMVARGDMGVEIALEEIPSIQKLLITKGYTAGKQVITATQMLESMIHNPRPTRAETTDVANAIYDGTSAIMLSGETAAGHFPVEAVETMARIAIRTERDIDYKKRFLTRPPQIDMASITNAISHATCSAAYDLRARAIVTVTKSGDTAKMISKFRPACTIIGCSPDPRVVRQMSLSWGVQPLLIEEKESSDELFSHAVDRAQKAGFVQNGDLVVITAGVPLGVSGTTNMLRVNVVGEHV